MKYDIEALKRKMLVKYPFFGSVLANVKYQEDKKIPTAATDGHVIFYNPDFLGKLDTSEQTFVFAHEVCHIAFNHILRSEGKETQLWNIATDGVINQFLKKDGLKMVEGGVDIADAINYNAEDLYEKLLKEAPKMKANSSSDQGQSGGSDSQSQSGSLGGQPQDNKQNSSGNDGSQNDDKSKQDVGHDSHSMWADAVKKAKEEKEKKGQKDKEQTNQNNGSSNKFKDTSEKGNEELKEKQDELQKMGEKDAFDENRKEKKKQLEDLRDNIMDQISQGMSSDGSYRNTNNIGVARPIIDWRYALKEAVKHDVDWSYQNATIESGVIVPHLEEFPVPETEIVIDTSGSINEELLKNFLREAKNILKYSKLKVGCFDTRFYGFHDIRTEKDIDDMKFQGGGGTNFNVAVNAFTNRVENKIIFTDGEASMPTKAVDAIWLVFGGRNINPKGGKVIKITREQLNRL